MNTDKKNISPEILAPAGNMDSFLSAIAAGADAIYCGLKKFSARMEAENFNLNDLIRLSNIAHEKNIKLYIAFNSLLKSDEIYEAGKLLYNLNKFIKPNAIIIQDIGLILLLKQIDFQGEIHISTLANVSFSRALKFIKNNLSINRVVLPRELNIDEIKALSSEYNKDMDLEVFVHGALCYGVSGRCYWSSFLGGKSGLRGRCLQPCRRTYRQNKISNKFFSCNDISIDVLVKLLLSISNISAWKIEGRKKGPHYVFNTTLAYKILRDNPNDSVAKKEALDLLSKALGRQTTHYNFLPQRPINPIQKNNHSGSGLLIGKISALKSDNYFVTKQDLFPGDRLRIGYEDGAKNNINIITKPIKKNDKYFLKSNFIKKDDPVFLIDRRGDKLKDKLLKLREELSKQFFENISESNFDIIIDSKTSNKLNFINRDLYIYRSNLKQSKKNIALWISNETIRNTPKDKISNLWWCLPPVLWQKDEKTWEEYINYLLDNGAKNFILNILWQISFFPLNQGLNLWAGPFCNIYNRLSIEVIAKVGFSGVIISPELTKDDYFMIPKMSHLPLGVVISGNWPLCISRTVSKDLEINSSFISPKGEEGYVVKYGDDFWVYSNWRLNLSEQKELFKKAGYSLFLYIDEPIPESIVMKNRPGLWNWNIELK